jgi:hypothetical protein
MPRRSRFAWKGNERKIKYKKSEKNRINNGMMRKVKQQINNSKCYIRICPKLSDQH